MAPRPRPLEFRLWQAYYFVKFSLQLLRGPLIVFGVLLAVGVPPMLFKRYGLSGHETLHALAMVLSVMFLVFSVASRLTWEEALKDLVYIAGCIAVSLLISLAVFY